ncbi:MAG: hypothetical protein J6B87_07355 [Clostridia bacterium]|nr:hypothetical protein [Clostridia bacterium]
MTEKRFYRDFSGEYGTSIRDKLNDDKPVFIFSVHDSEDLCDIFNELANKNEQLKKEIEIGKEYCKILETDLGNCADNRILLQKESKELKQEIETLKIEIAELRESEKDNYNITDGLW